MFFFSLSLIVTTIISIITMFQGYYKTSVNFDEQLQNNNFPIAIYSPKFFIYTSIIVIVLALFAIIEALNNFFNKDFSTYLTLYLPMLIASAAIFILCIRSLIITPQKLIIHPLSITIHSLFSTKSYDFSSIQQIKILNSTTRHNIEVYIHLILINGDIVHISDQYMTSITSIAKLITDIKPSLAEDNDDYTSTEPAEPAEQSANDHAETIVFSLGFVQSYSPCASIILAIVFFIGFMIHLGSPISLIILIMFIPCLVAMLGICFSLIAHNKIVLYEECFELYDRLKHSKKYYYKNIMDLRVVTSTSNKSTDDYLHLELDSGKIIRLVASDFNIIDVRILGNIFRLRMRKE